MKNIHIIYTKIFRAFLVLAFWVMPALVFGQNIEDKVQIAEKVEKEQLKAQEVPLKFDAKKQVGITKKDSLFLQEEKLKTLTAQYKALKKTEKPNDKQKQQANELAYKIETLQLEITNQNQYRRK